MKYIVFLLLIFFCCREAWGQSPSSISGFVMDRENNKMVPSVNVKLLNTKDSSLYKITLTSEQGIFKLENIQSNTYLLHLSHINYQDIIISLRTKEDYKKIDTITVKLKVRKIDEVAVLPPIYYNKDTLEINTASFKLDSNAVISDLLGKVPGFVLWGNGDVTFNGKKIESFVVNGKKFFSGNAKMIMQNLPKTLASSIQLYNVANSKEYIKKDSVLELNVRTQKQGLSLFGNAELNIGKKYDTSLGLNIFTKSALQVSAFYNKNNVNKQINDYDEYSVLSTYKPDNYLSKRNLLLPGENTLKIYGAALNYSFTEKPDRELIDKISYSIDHKDNRTFFENNYKSETTDGTIQNSQSSKTVREGYDTKNKVNYHFSKTDINLSASLQLNKGFSHINVEDSASYNINNQNNSNQSSNDQFIYEKGFDFGLNGRYKFINPRMNLIFSYKSAYQDKDGTEKIFMNNNIESELRNNTQVTRIKKNDLNINMTDIPFIRRWGTSFFVKTTIRTNNTEDDKDIIKNEQLSEELSYNNILRQNSYILKSGVNISRNKSLTNRYSRSGYLSIFLKAEKYKQDQKSTNIQLTDALSSGQVTPGLSFSYKKEVNNKYTNTILIDLESQNKIPEIYNRVFTLDSLYRNSIKIGNRNLFPETENTLSIKLNRDKRTTNESLNFNYIHTKNGFINNISTVNNRYIFNYLSNYEHAIRNLSLNYNVRKYVKKTAVEITGFMQIHWNNTNRPTLIDSILIKTTTNTFGHNFTLQLDHKDFLVYNLSNYLSYILVDRTSNYRILNNSLHLDARFTYRKNLTIDVSFINEYSKGTVSQSNNILNLLLGYRFLKKKNGEINFSVWDILNNNKNINSTFDGIYTSSGYTNRIRRYINLGLKYYIRKF